MPKAATVWDQDLYRRYYRWLARNPFVIVGTAVAAWIWAPWWIGLGTTVYAAMRIAWIVRTRTPG
jgi:hypothetical protein